MSKTLDFIPKLGLLGEVKLQLIQVQYEQYEVEIKIKMQSSENLVNNKRGPHRS